MNMFGMKQLALPQPFQEQIRRVFGERGSDWLDRLPSLLEQAAERWHLTDCRLPAGLSYNFICFAQSASFGPVALKLGVPHPELFTEMTALARYQGRHICRLHAHDEEMGALLLERITPGDTLHTVADPRQRIRTAAGLIARLPIPIAGDHGLPAYGDWVARAFARARQERSGGPRLLRLTDAAERLFAALHAGAAQPQVLLHGDLHHQNILADDAGGWKAIDPKGAVGMPVLEAGRFIQNELELAAPAEQPAHLELITGLLSAELGLPVRSLAIAAFVDAVLGTCWHDEDHSPPAVVAERLEACELFERHASA